jgi:hypothetical protein
VDKDGMGVDGEEEKRKKEEIKETNLLISSPYP